MPSFSTEVPHSLGREEATRRLKGFVDQVSERYKEQVSSMQGEWNEHVLTFAMIAYQIKIEGVLTVEEDKAVVNGTLPFAAMMFRGKIQSAIAAELEKALR